jgi:hypothetical protein
VGAKDVVIRGAGVLVVAGVLIGGGSYVVGGGESVTANIFVDGSGSCVDNASPATYSSADACESLAAACAVADGGETVMVKAGTYGTQNLVRSSCDPPTTVTFLPYSGDTVTFNGNLNLGATGTATLGPRKLTFTGPFTWAATNDTAFPNVYGVDQVTFTNIDAPKIDIDTSSNVLVENSNFHDCVANASNGECLPRIYGVSSNITFEDNLMHGHATTNPDLWHTVGIALFTNDNSTLDNIIIRRNKFWDNEVTNIRVQERGSTNNQMNDILIESNWFNRPFNVNNGVDPPSSPTSNAIDIDTPIGGLIIRNNTFAEGTYIQCNDSVGTTGECGEVADVALFTGNALTAVMPGSFGTCNTRNATFSYNYMTDWSDSITSGSQCGATNTVVSAATYTGKLVNSTDHGSFDFHWTGAAATPPDDFVPTSADGGCAPFDIDGVARPVGTSCDAGSDER